MVEPIPYTRPSITEREVAYATDAARHGWGPRCYEYIERFEAAFCTHLGVSYAIATSSGTGALQLGFAAMGLGAGDEVILGDCNWIASAAPIAHLGATPVFVDVDPISWCLDPAAVEAAITPKTRAILAVHLYGNLADVDALREIARRRNVLLVEDAAEAVGSSWRGEKAGAMGAFGAFSFHGTKTITTGEGGVLVTNDPALFETALTLSNHGRQRGETRAFWAERLGYKFKMSNIEAAIGVAQMERVEALIARKREVFAIYADALGDLPGARLNPEPAHAQNGYWMPTIVFEAQVGATRERLIEGLRAVGADARPIFWPLSSLPPFGAGPGAPVAASIAAHGVNLPSFPDMTLEQQMRVVEAVRGAV